MNANLMRRLTAFLLITGLVAGFYCHAAEVRNGRPVAPPAVWSWGGETVDGLQLCLRPAMPVFTLGERVYVDLSLRNMTGDPITVLDMVHISQQTFEVKTSDGKKAPRPTVLEDYFGPKPPPLAIRGHHFYGKTAQLSDFYFLDRTGEYIATAEHSCSLGANGYYAKHIKSNPVTIRIQKASFAPRRAEGWALEMAGLIYEKDIPQGVRLRIRREKDQATLFLNEGFVCFITRPDGVQCYRGGGAAAEPGRQPTWEAKTVLPGEALELCLMLPRAEEIFTQEGVYDFQLTYRNRSLSINGVPVWRGELASERMRLQVPAQKKHE